jgi:hypothetical protein
LFFLPEFLKGGARALIPMTAAAAIALGTGCYGNGPRLVGAGRLS